MEQLLRARVWGGIRQPGRSGERRREGLVVVGDVGGRGLRWSFRFRVRTQKAREFSGFRTLSFLLPFGFPVVCFWLRFGEEGWFVAVTADRKGGGGLGEASRGSGLKQEEGCELRRFMVVLGMCWLGISFSSSSLFSWCFVADGSAVWGCARGVVSIVSGLLVVRKHGEHGLMMVSGLLGRGFEGVLAAVWEGLREFQSHMVMGVVEGAVQGGLGGADHLGFGL